MSSLDTQQIKNEIASVYTTNSITYAADIRPFLEAFTDDIDAAIDAVAFGDLADSSIDTSNMSAGDIIKLNSSGNFEGFTPPWIEDISSFTTDDLSEGASNLYFTDARALAAVNGENVSIFNNDVPYLVNNGGTDNFIPRFDGGGAVETSFIQEDQTTDDGFWTLGDPNGTPVGLKVSGGEFQFRDAADSAFASIRVGNVIWENPIELNKEIVRVADNFQLLNSDLVSGDPKEDAGIDINRPDASDARLFYNEENGQWEAGLEGATSKVFLDGDQDGSTILWDGTKLYVANVTAQELAQVGNINSLGISNNNWSHVSTMDQDVATSDDVTFDRVRADHFTDVIASIPFSGTQNPLSIGGGGSARLNGSSSPVIEGIDKEGFIDGDHVRLYVNPSSDPIVFTDGSVGNSNDLVIDDSGSSTLTMDPKGHIDFKRCNTTGRWLLAGYNSHLGTYNP